MSPKSVPLIAGVLIGLLLSILAIRFYITLFKSISVDSFNVHDEKKTKSELTKIKANLDIKLQHSAINKGNELVPNSIIDLTQTTNASNSYNIVNIGHTGSSDTFDQHATAHTPNKNSLIANRVVSPEQTTTAVIVDAAKTNVRTEKFRKNPITRAELINFNDDVVPASATTETKKKTPMIKYKGVCPYSFKVFVYPLPPELPSFRISEEARRNHTLHVCFKCIFEQFSLEYIMNDFFLNFCGRTYDPESADYFYLPVVRDAEYRLMMHKRGGRNPSATENAILNVLEKNDFTQWSLLFNCTDKYWRRRSGFDHIFVMPAPVTNFKHEGSRRGFFHYMPHLHAPIFINIEYSLPFLKEYPVCSTEKNIVLPYPIIDPNLYNGFYHYEYQKYDKMFTNISYTNKYAQFNITRPALIFYSGGMHGECVLIRQAIRQIMMNASKVQGQRTRGKRNVHIHRSHDNTYFDNPVYQQYHISIIPPKELSQHVHRELSFLSSIFCPIPVGDSPSSKRMYDVMNFGCIPVILSDDLVWALSAETGGYLDPRHFALRLPQCTVQHTMDALLVRYKKHQHVFGYLPHSNTSVYNILKSVYLESQFASSVYAGSMYLNPLLLILLHVPAKDIVYMQKKVREAAHYYRYYKLDNSMRSIPIASHREPDGGAIDLLARSLYDRKVKGIQKIGQQCQEERLRKGHNYIGSYPCEKPN